MTSKPQVEHTQYYITKYTQEKHACQWKTNTSGDKKGEEKNPIYMAALLRAGEKLQKLTPGNTMTEENCVINQSDWHYYYYYH